jgi:PAS domain S-box-containing protein
LSQPLASTALLRWRQRLAQIRPSQAIAGFGAVLAMAILAFTAFTLWYLRAEALDDAERQVGKLSLLLGEQTSRAIEAVDVVLQGTVEKLRGADSGAPESVHEMLKGQFVGLPQLRTVFVTDRSGRTLYDSRHFPPPQLDLNDRRYFTVHRDAQASGLYVGEPITSRVDGLPGFQLSRRYDDASGRFAGVVAATVEPRHFLELYRSIDLGPGSVITLQRRDGTVLTRHPYVESLIGTSMAGTAGHRLILSRGDSGTFRQTGQPGQVDRISASRALNRFPLVLYVSMAEGAALSGWYRQAYIFGGGALAGLATFLVLLSLLARTFRRQEQLTAALAASEQRFRDVVESASDWMWEMGPDLKFTWFSDRLITSTGIRPQDVLGRSRMDVTAAQLDDPAWTTHLQMLRDRLPFRGFVYAHRRHDGAIRWLKVSGLPVYDEHGAFRGYRGTGTDITSEYQAEERARLAQERLQAAVEFLPDGFVLYDAADRLVLCNERYRRMHAQTAAAIQPGMKFEDIVRASHQSGEQDAGDGDVEQAIRQRLELHRQARQPFELISRSRVIRIAERQTGDGGTVGLHIDITELKRREAALLQAKQQADAANRAKS